MKKLTLILCSLVLLSACRHKSGSGNIITQTRNPGSFSAISINGDFAVEIKQGASEQVILEADDNLMEYIETTLSGHELKIGLRNIHNLRDAHLKVFITAPEINNISTSASAEVVVKDKLKSMQNIRLQASSGSSIKTTLDAPGVTVGASSGGELILSGRTKDFSAESSSGSTINAVELLTENSNVSASSGSSLSVHASVTLDATASSSGDISYRGGANVKKSVSSGGEVEKDN